MTRLAVAVAVALALAALGGARPAGAMPVAPTLVSPARGETVADYGPTLRWTNPPGTTQFHLQVVPANNDGPGLDVHGFEAAAAFSIPAPPAWYGLLPDMTYAWRLRVSDARTFADLGDASWSTWAESTFRTPAVGDIVLAPITPVIGETVTTRMPTIIFSTSRPDVFYFELQVSKDPTFTEEAARAVAPVYSALLHGGVTLPRHAYTVPAAAGLEDKTVYYWRVRPRVQGDGQPAPWSQNYSFRTDFGAAPPVTLGAIAIGTRRAADGSCGVEDAAAEVAAQPDLTAWFSAHTYTGAGRVVRFWYLDNQVTPPITADLSSGCHAVGFEPAAGRPIPAGQWRLEVWQAGRLLGSAGVRVTPPTGLAIGRITVGTGLGSAPRCAVTGAGTAFPAGATRLYFRWNWVGDGEYRVRILKDGGVAAFGVVLTPRSGGCYRGDFGGFSPGAWEIVVTDPAGRTLSRAAFTVG